MFKFACKIVLFSLPITIIFIFPGIVWYYSREYEPLHDVIVEQTKNPETLFASAYVTPVKAYKEALLGMRSSQVVIVGSSRAWEMHSSFFIHPEDFINLGSITINPSDLADLSSRLSKSPQLKIVILELDQRFFNPETNDDAQEKASRQPSTFDILKIFFGGAWREPYVDYISGKFTMMNLIQESGESRSIGIKALVQHEGFLGDGSYIYYDAPRDTLHREHLLAQMDSFAKYLKLNPGTWQYGATIDETRLADVGAFLDAMHARGITVIGYVPPVNPIIGSAIDSLGNGYSKSKKDLPIRVGQLFAERDLPFFDLTDPTTTGSTGMEFIDDVHTTDKQTALILSYLAKHDTVLLPYVNTKSLDTLVATAHGDFLGQ